VINHYYLSKYKRFTFHNLTVLKLDIPIAYLIKRISRNIGSDVVWTEVPDESHNTRGIADRDVLGLPQHRIIKDESLSGAGESLIITESSDTYEDVTMVARDEGRVYAEVPGYGRLRPTTSEGTPRPLELFESEVTEIGLQKLSVNINWIYREIALLRFIIAENINFF